MIIDRKILEKFKNKIFTNNLDVYHRFIGYLLYAFFDIGMDVIVFQGVFR